MTKQIRIYTREACTFCEKAKRLLESKDVVFHELNATFNPAFRNEMIAESGGKSTFPQIFFGKNHIGGCDVLLALEAEGKLDEMLRE